MENYMGLAILYGIAAVAVGVPLYVIIRSIINYVRAIDGRGTIVIKALVVLGIWIVLSFTLLMLAFMAAFEGGTLPDGTKASTPVTTMSIVFVFIYLAAGAAMVYWVRLQPGWKTMRKARSEG